LTRILLILALLLSGLLAGGNVDRAFVAMPAWQQVGAVAWSEFSRHADLGNGLVLYPVEAIGGALLTLAVAIGLHFDRRAPRVATYCLYAAVLFAAGGLLFTVRAAPLMLGLRGESDPAALQRAFEGFWYWGNLRAACQVLAFLALLAATAALWRHDKSEPATVAPAPDRATS
jgi:hypothetical protein